MEKRFGKKNRTIVVTGSESTGKTTLTVELADYFHGFIMPEYAREYVEKLHRKYLYDDVEYIAQQQFQLLVNAKKRTEDYLFMDTYLIIIKIWFLEVFSKYPKWLDTILSENFIDLFLLCDTDIPWIPDPVRENGGEKREILQKKYIEQLEEFKLPYRIIHGKGKERLEIAINIINSYF